MDAKYIKIIDVEDRINNRNNKSSSKKRNKFLYILLLLLSLSIFICIVYMVFLMVDKLLINHNGSLKEYLNDFNLLYTNKNENLIFEDDGIYNDTVIEIPPDTQEFQLLDLNVMEGPITLDREKDDGSKINVYSMMMDPLDNSIIYDEIEKFDSMNDTYYPMKVDYLCELRKRFPPEGQKGYSISCPPYHRIAINSTFYGRFAKDTEHCNRYPSGKIVPRSKLFRSNTCGYEPLSKVKQFCEGKRECVLKPHNYFFVDLFPVVYKYLYVSYRCIKQKEFEKTKFDIVMYTDKIGVNSAFENSISQFYQYAKIHGYDFHWNNKGYNNVRLPYYMKFNSLLKSLTKGLEENKYDWIVWIDGDTVLTNPNIELEAFLPEDSNIHFIASDDINGLNAGIFFLRVHPWSYDFLIRAAAYSFYHKDKLLKYSDQTSLNNVLFEFNEVDHYVIVPKNWFNSYIDDHQKGDFLIHLAGEHNKDSLTRSIRFEIMSNITSYISKTSREMRQEVLEYYRLPKEDQHKIIYE